MPNADPPHVTRQKWNKNKSGMRLRVWQQMMSCSIQLLRTPSVCMCMSLRGNPVINTSVSSKPTSQPPEHTHAFP